MPFRRPLIGLILIGIVVSAFTAFGLPLGDSMQLNYAWSFQYSETISWADPFPRFLPQLWAGFGGYDFFFYAPLPFWAVAVLIDPLCLGCLPETELVIGSALFLVASAVTMFAFLKSFFASGSAALGATVYVILPYHLLMDWFERQAIGEFTAYAFLPLIALGIERIRQGGNGGWVLALGVAGTTLSHLPTALLASHLFVVLCLAFLPGLPGGLPSAPQFLFRTTWFASVGLGLASFYWLPAVILIDTVSPDVLYTPHFEAWRWLYGTTADSPQQAFPNRIFFCFLASAPLLLASLFYSRGPALTWILVPVSFVLFMNSVFSEVIWREWIISRVQFPWRMMSFIDLAAGLAVASLAAHANGLVGKVIRLGGFVVLLSLYVLLANTITMSRPDTTTSSAGSWIGAPEYMSPEFSAALHARLGLDQITLNDLEKAALSAGDAASDFRAAHPDVNILERGTRKVVVAPEAGSSILSLPNQYWFLWQAETASGKPLTIVPNSEFGTIDIISPPDGLDGEVFVVSLPYHWSETTGFLVSLLSIVFLLASKSARLALGSHIWRTAQD